MSRLAVMAKLRVEGMIGGRTVSATWDRGEVHADPGLIWLIRLRGDAGETVALTPTGPFFRAGVADPRQFEATLRNLLDDVHVEVLDADGLPPWPEAPSGSEEAPALYEA